MKTRILMIAAALVCVGVLLFAGSSAAEETSTPTSTPAASAVAATGTAQTPQPPSTAVWGTPRTKTIVLVGTYIPSKIRRVGRITDGPLDVKVIDHGEIVNSGAATVAQVLAMDPSITFKRH